jgi:hypothetical protein
MLGVVVDSPRQHRPQNAGVLVGQRHQSLLLSDTVAQLQQPLRDAVIAIGRGQQSGLGALDQQGAQVVIAALGDATQPVFAAGGVLARHQSNPGAELACALELVHVAHGSLYCMAHNIEKLSKAGLGQVGVQ